MLSEKLQRELDKILESSLDIICTIDKKGFFVRVSSAVLGLLGYSLIRLKVSAVIPK
jgi:PAS domain S-box-containing protein